jgi:hypothetical protein
MMVKDGEDVTVSDPVTTPPPVVVTPGENVLVVADQLAGTQVALTQVTVSESSWIAIQEDNNGLPGVILGAQRFDEGVYTGRTVDLLRGTTAGNTYHAVIRYDDGDKDFDHTKDLPVLEGLAGTFVMSTFTTSPAPAQ